MSQFKIYTSEDSDSPVLNGASGSLARVLSASLYAGYGSTVSAGWLCPFSASNKMVFQQPSGSGFYLRVDDNYGREAKITGYESMTTVDTGSGQFPTYAQSPIGSGSLTVRKSLPTNISGSGRKWKIYADDYTMYMFISTGDNTTHYFGWMFGDIFSFKPADAYKCMIIARPTENDGANSYFDLLNGFNSLSTIGGHYMARPYTGIGASMYVGKHGHTVKGTSTMVGYIPFPNPQDGSFWLSPIWVNENTNTLRGKLRGLWQWLHVGAVNFTDTTTLSGSGELHGKTFNVVNSGSTVNLYIMESSNTVGVSD